MSMERLLVLSEENRVNIVKCKCRKNVQGTILNYCVLL